MFVFYGFRHLNQGLLPKKTAYPVCPAGLGGSVAFFETADKEVSVGLFLTTQQLLLISLKIITRRKK